jgi:hypothetical protein
MALLSTFEVVVLAFAAFPSTIWELEIVCSLLNFLRRLNYIRFELRLESSECWSISLMKRLDTTSTSSDMSKLIDFSDGW